MTSLVDWQNFFVAEVGASAALAGLLFVALSLNMGKILANAGLPNRALQALTLLVGILLVASVALVPGEGLRLVGLEIVVVGGALAAVAIRISLRSLSLTDRQYRPWHTGESSVVALATLLYPAAGVLLLLQRPIGAYLIVPAFLVSFVVAIVDSWVLLVEINR